MQRWSVSVWCGLRVGRPSFPSRRMFEFTQHRDWPPHRSEGGQVISRLQQQTKYLPVTHTFRGTHSDTPHRQFPQIIPMSGLDGHACTSSPSNRCCQGFVLGRGEWVWVCERVCVSWCVWRWFLLSGVRLLGNSPLFGGAVTWGLRLPLFLGLACLVPPTSHFEKTGVTLCVCVCVWVSECECASAC